MQVQGWLCRRLKVPRAGQEVTSAGPRFDRQREAEVVAEAVAEAPEMTAQDAVIPAFPRGSFSV